MSEFTGTRCDGCGKLSEVEAIDIVDELGWEEDDRGGHACPDCQQAAKNLEESTATAEDMGSFGELVTKAANAVIDSPEAEKVRAERLAEFQRIKKETFKQIRKDMTAGGYTKEQIDESLAETEKELDKLYENKYNPNFKLEA